MEGFWAVVHNRGMSLSIQFPAIFTVADVISVDASIASPSASGVSAVAFGRLSVPFANQDLPRVRQLIEDLSAMDAARSSGVAEVEFRDRRTRFRSLDELMTSRASLLNALRGLVVVADDLPRKRRNPLRIRYIRYARGY